MAKRTEYLVTHYAQNGTVIKQLRVPKSINMPRLLERLICRELDDQSIIASCRRSNSKSFYDPFQVIDMREEHRREQALAAMKADPEASYFEARGAPIPLGKLLMMAGFQHEYHVTEVETVR